MTTELLRLAELCEQASGPDRELDAEIAHAVGIRIQTISRSVLADPFGKSSAMREVSDSTALSYTASLDAAMSLVPDLEAAEAGYSDIFWRLGNDGEGGNPADFKAEVLICSMFTSKRFAATAITPALALCAASLRARSQESGK